MPWKLPNLNIGGANARARCVLQKCDFRKCRICKSAAVYVSCVLWCTGGHGAAVGAFNRRLKVRSKAKCSEQHDAATAT
jgi:hypothetical protein